MEERSSLSIKALGIGLAIGLIVGLGLGYMISPAGVGTTELEQQIGVLEGQVDNLQDQLENKDTQISNLQAQIAALESQTSEKDSQIASLQSQISELESQIDELQKLMPPIRKGEWNLITTFQGKSETTTDYYYVAGTELRINWTWASSVEEFARFGMSLYKEGQTTPTEWLFDLQKEGTSHVHNIEAADYYLDISEANLDQWGVTVEAS